MNSGDDATDDLMKAIIEALNKYIFMLAERQIRLAFEQSEKEVEDLEYGKEGKKGYRDIYYFFVIPLCALMIFDFIYYRRKVSIK